MQIKYLNIKELKPYENNPRFNDEAVDAVANSIKEFGFINPIVIDKNKVVVAGHTRLKAAEKLGLTEAPTITIDNLSEEQINAFRLADNKVAEISQWDEKALWEELQKIDKIDMGAFGFDDNFYFEEETPVFEDEVPTPSEAKETKVKDGDIWLLGNHKLMCGSSTEIKNVQKLFNGELADMVLTDPPYNVDLSTINKAKVRLSHEKYIGANTDEIINDNLDDESFYNFLINFYNAMYSVLKEGGVFYIFHAETEGVNFMKALNDVGLKTRQTLIWVKNTLVLGLSDYQWKHEPCLYGWKDGAGHYFIDDRTQTTTIGEIDLKYATREELINEIKNLRDQLNTTTIHVDKPIKNDLHPTMKPIKLCSRLIRNSSKKGDIVYDGFGGSGSTLIACEQTERTCYTIELDPHYCDVIIERWETLTGKKAKKIK